MVCTWSKHCRSVLTLASRLCGHSPTHLHNCLCSFVAIVAIAIPQPLGAISVVLRKHGTQMRWHSCILVVLAQHSIAQIQDTKMAGIQGKFQLKHIRKLAMYCHCLLTSKSKFAVNPIDPMLNQGWNHTQNINSKQYFTWWYTSAGICALLTFPAEQAADPVSQDHKWRQKCPVRISASCAQTRDPAAWGPKKSQQQAAFVVEMPYAPTTHPRHHCSAHSLYLEQHSRASVHYGLLYRQKGIWIWSGSKTLLACIPSSFKSTLLATNVDFSGIQRRHWLLLSSDSLSGR